MEAWCTNALTLWLQLQLQRQTVLMSASSSAPPTVLTNGLPPAGAPTPGRGSLFGPTSIVPDSSMQPWPPTSLKTNTAEAIDHKMVGEMAAVDK